MPDTPSHREFDLDLSERDIQALNGPDSVAALFARLGYNTNARTAQTPGNLGIATETTLRPIRRIELIADNEALFQVYLFELSSVTVTHTRALARAFRNRAGNFLLVLTTGSYEQIDFVLLEKYLPTATGASGIGERQVGVRPRVLTVERRKPGRLQLRVLKRFSWTEADPIAQHEKLLSAYAVADWSEEHFNNRALFSDYYLLERLREFPEWRDDPKPAYKTLRDLYRGAAQRVAGKPEAALRGDLLEPALSALGFRAEASQPAANHAEPDYLLYSGADKTVLGLLLAYPWGRSLDGKDDQRDKETSEENPGAVVVSLLEKNEAPWVIVTNGKLWRLYAKQTHSRATNYYELDLGEVLAEAGPVAADPAEAFRYFWLLFRSEAFVRRPVRREGKEVNLCLLDQLLLDSEDYAKELGSRLKERVFEDIFPHLAQGFVADMRARNAAAEISQSTLDAVFQGTLTLLYRALFLLYAEARDLLPVKEVRGYHEASLAKLKREIAEQAGDISDEVEAKLSHAYRDDSYGLYGRLEHLFRVIDHGDATLNVPFYNGGLFLTEPEDEDDTPEAAAARFLRNHKVPDRHLARAIDLLARDVDSKLQSLVFIDYKSLGVRQLGSMYEGLLEFKLRVAEKKLAIVKEKGREVYQPFSELGEREKEKAEKQNCIVRKGAIYLENDKRERKATGSYYTPDYIVEYIVEHAVGPVLDEKFEAMRPKLREAQAARRAFQARVESFRNKGITPLPHSSEIEKPEQALVDELFDIKVLDPAMGSGHFLVEAVDYITDRMLTFLNAFPSNPVQAHLERMRDTILKEAEDQGITLDPARLTNVNLLKRHVLKRCIYGVDLNPMAVELAKVSLWLDCFTLGAPLSFLDHHLRCGNSLIGITEEQFEASQKGQMNLLAGTQYAGAKLAVGAMVAIGAMPDITPEQARESRKQYHFASEALVPVRRLFDVYSSQWFGNQPQVVGKGKNRQEHNPALEFLRDASCEPWSQRPDKARLPQLFKEVADKAMDASRRYRFFHWELEFPEVFFGPREDAPQVIERKDGAGFDSIICNPPYLSVDAFGAGSHESRFLKHEFANFWQDKTDILVFFLARNLQLAAKAWGAIVKSAFIKGTKSSKLRTELTTGGYVKEIHEFRNEYVFDDADVQTAVIIGGWLSGGRLDLTEWMAGPVPFSIRVPVIALGQLSHVGQGMQTGANEVFVVPQGTLPKSALRRRVRGEDVDRYEMSEPVDWVLWVEDYRAFKDLPTSVQDYLNQHAARLKDRAAFRRGNCEWFKFTWPLHKEYYRYPKLWTPFRSPYNQFCVDEGDKSIGLTDTTCVFVTAEDYSPHYLLALLNSKLMEICLKSLSKATGGGYHEYFPGVVEKLPIRSIVFKSSPRTRRDAMEALTSRYARFARNGDVEELLNIIERNLSDAMQKSDDLIHDVLAFLAERMISLNGERQKEQKRFIGWLETTLRIRADSNGNKGVEILARKSRLRNYLGDYQKDEAAMSEEELFDMLAKNRNRIGANIADPHFRAGVNEEFAKSLSVLRPIKQQLAQTDHLIDLIVYRLYGLTEDEITIVESRDGTV